MEPQLTVQLPPQVRFWVQAEPLCGLQLRLQLEATPQSMAPVHEPQPHFTAQGPAPQVMSPEQARPPVVVAQSMSQLSAWLQSMVPLQELKGHATLQWNPGGQVQPVAQSMVQVKPLHA